MLERYHSHNQFQDSPEQFYQSDPQLAALTKLKYKHSSDWWRALDPHMAGIYILTGGRQNCIIIGILW
jgi:hypothetical protein